jgi:hypothetical protein
VALLDDLVTELQTAGVGTSGTTIFAGTIPATPDACVALLHYASESPDRLMGATGVRATSVERPRVQVVARAMTYQAAESKARQALTALDWLGPKTIGGTRYFHVMALQRPPFFLRRDENDRTLMAFNVSVARQATT